MKIMRSLPLLFAIGAMLMMNVNARAAPHPWLEKAADKTQSIARRIPPPRHAMRSTLPKDSFGAWLRKLPLRPAGARVRLYNGQEKAYQAGQVAVVDMDVGARDLQQCADAVIRLRAEYLWATGRATHVAFNLTNGMRVAWARWASGDRVVVDGNKTSWRSGKAPASSHAAFRRYLDFIFTYAGSASLERELAPRAPSEVEPGDVLIQGGHPGHAVIVLDMARDARGRPYLLLGQSFMPAQEIHVLANPQDAKLSPWYRLDSLRSGLQTPEWGPFRRENLKRFK